MPFWTRAYFALTASLLLLAISKDASADTRGFPDSISVARRVDSVEGLFFSLSGTGVPPDSLPDRDSLFLSQTNNIPFVSGPANVGPLNRPTIGLTGRSDFTQSGTYTVTWTLANDDVPPGLTLDTTTVVVHDLYPPSNVRAYYLDPPPSVPVSNGSGVIGLVVWDGSGPTSDPIAWNGFRVRRTIHGASSEPMAVIGQHVNWGRLVRSNFHTPASALCFGQWAPCDPDSFVFNGTGLFFRGFKGNSLGNGKYAIDYPPGAPVDECSDCWVYADLTAMAGFNVDYAVTTIGPFEDNDYVETPLALSPVVSILPATPPAENLERVAVVPNPFKGNAQWDPAVGEGRVHFIHLPEGSTVRVFTSNGDLVRELKLDVNSSPGGQTGELFWDLRNGEGRKIVSGIYIYQVETPQGRTHKGHFVIIK